MEFSSYDCDVSLEEGFTPEKDIFQREPFATALTGILEKSSRPISMMIDAKWGEGKTTFIKMWAGELRKKGFPVIYFDAFETDYCSDPFEALAASITTFVSESLPQEEALKENLINQCSKRLRFFGKAGIKLSTQAIVHHLIGPNAPEAIKEIENTLAVCASEGIENLWEENLKSHKSDVENTQKLRTALSSIPEKFSDGTMPLIIFIDELDRCRPDYAIALLERVKHFMLTDKVHYVHSVNFSQLETSVRAIYGEKTEADLYFQKFFDFRFALPKMGGRRDLNVSELYARKLVEKNSDVFESSEKYETYGKIVTTLAHVLSPSLRTLEKINDQLIVSQFKTLPKHSFPPAILVSSIFIKHCDKGLYEKLLQKKLSIGDLETFFGITYTDDRSNINTDIEDQVRYILCCWTRCLVEDIPDSDYHAKKAATGLTIKDFPSYPMRIATEYIEQFNLQ